MAFKAIFQDVSNIVGDLGFGLGRGGELVRLFDSIGTLIDKAQYDDSDPWPDLPDGNGSTLELNDLDEDNAMGTNWNASEEFGSSVGLLTQVLHLGKVGNGYLKIFKFIITAPTVITQEPRFTLI